MEFSGVFRKRSIDMVTRGWRDVDEFESRSIAKWYHLKCLNKSRAADAMLIGAPTGISVVGYELLLNRSSIPIPLQIIKRNNRLKNDFLMENKE